MFTYRLFLLAASALLTVAAATAQVRHVTTMRTTQGRNATAMEVYEFDYVDVQPQFPGGEHGLVNFINNTRVYPYEAYHNRVQGRVLCSFIVNADGRVSHVRVIRGSGDESLDREAMRVIGEMPRWTAGRVGRNAVAVRCVLPIAFRL
ncbi:MAG: energy transducer TonB [Muribaculaceae bacterium]|nr:energy transducer TonB [Muribaculaceae bacterium]